MNLHGAALDKTSTTILLVAGVAIAVYYFGKKGITAAASAIGNVNANTPYAGYGVAGTLGNVANQASGGGLAAAGTNLGGWLYNLVNPTYNPNASSGAGPGIALPVDPMTIANQSGGWDSSPPAGIALPTNKTNVADNYWNYDPTVFTPSY